MRLHASVDERAVSYDVRRPERRFARIMNAMDMTGASTASAGSTSRRHRRSTDNALLFHENLLFHEKRRNVARPHMRNGIAYIVAFAGTFRAVQTFFPHE